MQLQVHRRTLCVCLTTLPAPPPHPKPHPPTHFLQVLLTFILVCLILYFGVVAPFNKLVKLFYGAAKKTRSCPECLSDIPLKATRCKFCCAAVEPLPTPSQQLTPSEQKLLGGESMGSGCRGGGGEGQIFRVCCHSQAAVPTHPSPCAFPCARGPAGRSTRHQDVSRRQERFRAAAARSVQQGVMPQRPGCSFSFFLLLPAYPVSRLSPPSFCR